MYVLPSLCMYVVMCNLVLSFFMVLCLSLSLFLSFVRCALCMSLVLYICSDFFSLRCLSFVGVFLLSLLRSFVSYFCMS